jgi:hypothetical protein
MSMDVLKWSERGVSPRRNRLAHPVTHMANTGRATKSGGPKITLRQPKQRGTTKMGQQ